MNRLLTGSRCDRASSFSAPSVRRLLSPQAKRDKSQRHGKITERWGGKMSKKYIYIWLGEGPTVSRSQAEEHQSNRHTSVDRDFKTGSGGEKRKEAKGLI